MKYLKTYDRGKKKDVSCGYIEGRTYFRDVKMEHLMLKFMGFGIQEDILGRLIQSHIQGVVLKAKKKTFKSTLADWMRHGIVEDFGHGRQVFLSIKYMNDQ